MRYDYDAFSLKKHVQTTSEKTDFLLLLWRILLPQPNIFISFPFDIYLSDGFLKADPFQALTRELTGVYQLTIHLHV